MLPGQHNLHCRFRSVKFCGTPCRTEQGTGQERARGGQRTVTGQEVHEEQVHKLPHLPTGVGGHGELQGLLGAARGSSSRPAGGVDGAGVAGGAVACWDYHESGPRG